MYHCVYTKHKPQQGRIVKAIAASIGAKVWELGQFSLSHIDRSDVVVFIGLIHGMGQLYKQILEQGQPYWYVDHAYFHSGYCEGNEWMRITANAFTQNRILSTWDQQRQDQYFSNIEIKPWRGLQGSYILASPPSDSVDYIFGQAHAWFDHACQQAESLLKLPVVIRHKSPRIYLDSNGQIIRKEQVHHKQSLQEQMGGAALVITYTSSIAIDAVLQGIPVHVHLRSSAWPVSSKLQSFQEPPRTAWVSSLCASQYHTREIASNHLSNLINI